jgi:NitT/TauT family transport system substrate-binding protein
MSHRLFLLVLVLGFLLVPNSVKSVGFAQEATAATELTQPTATRTYRIGTCPWIAWAPINIAEQKGMWKKRGLDVRVITQLGEDTGALEQKRVDLAIDMIGNFIGIHQKGIEITILAELDWSNGGDKIISHDKKTPIKKGDTIGVYHHDPAVIMLLANFLKDHQLTLNDVKIVEYHPEALNSHFIARSVSTIVSYEPYSLQAEQSGGTVVATSATYPGCMPEGIGGRSEVVANIPKRDLQLIFAGWLEAVEWSQDPKNWDEYCAIVNKYTFAEPTPFSSEAIQDMLKNVTIHSRKTLLERNATGGGLSQLIDQTRHVLHGANLLTKEFSAATLVNTSILQSVLLETPK